MDVMGDQEGDWQTNSEGNPKLSSSPTFFSTVMPTVMTYIRESIPRFINLNHQTTQKPNYFVYKQPPKTQVNFVKVFNIGRDQPHNSEREDSIEVSVMPTREKPSSSPQTDRSISASVSTLNETLIDAKNREAFNRENNPQNEQLVERQRQEIDVFLRQIRTARSLEKSLIQMENEEQEGDSSGDEDEVYSDKNHTVVLMEKKTNLEEDEEEGIDSIVVNDTSTLSPDSFSKAIEELEEGETESSEQGTEAPTSEELTPTPQAESSVKVVVSPSLVSKKRVILETMKITPKKDKSNSSKQKTEKKTNNALTTAMKKLNQYEKELSNSIQKLKSTPKQAKPSPKKTETPRVPSTQTWTNNNGRNNKLS